MEDNSTIVVVAVGGLIIALAIGVTLGYVWGTSEVVPAVREPLHVQRDESGRIVTILPGGV